MLLNSINVVNLLPLFWISDIWHSHLFHRYLFHPLVAWGGCAWPRFQTVQYNLYWTVFRKLSNTTFSEGNTDYIVRSRGANPALWLADRYVVYIYKIGWDPIYIYMIPANLVQTWDEQSSDVSIPGPGWNPSREIDRFHNNSPCSGEQPEP